MLVVKAILGGASIAGLLLTIGVAWTRRDNMVAARWQAGLLVGGLIWVVGVLLTAFLPGTETVLIANAAKSVGVPLMAIGHYFTVKTLLRPQQTTSLLERIGLFLVPLAYLALIALPATRPAMTGAAAVVDGRVLWPVPLAFWALMVFSFLLATWTAATEAQAIQSTAIGHRPLLRSHLIGAAFVLAGALLSGAVVLYHGGRFPAEAIEWVSVGLIGTAWVDLRAMMREQFLVVAPLPQAAVMGGVGDGILVFDTDGRLTDFNPLAAALLGPALTVGLDHARVRELIYGDGPVGSEARLGEREVRISERPIPDGLIVTLVDVSDANRFQRELLRLNGELREHVHSVERLRADLAQLAERDALTGLYNRRALDARLTELVATGTTCAFVVLDLDHFKEVNDTYGHLVGDELLVAAAERLRSLSLPGESVVRFGGEEFLLLLPGTTLAQASVRAEAIRKSFAEVGLNAGNQICQCVTVSVGVAASQPDDFQPYDTLRRADEALYRAKAAGRNRVESAAG